MLIAAANEARDATIEAAKLRSDLRMSHAAEIDGISGPLDQVKVNDGNWIVAAESGLRNEGTE